MKGVSYIGRPKSNTAMYVSKKVSHLLKNLDNVSGCVVFAEEGIEIDKKMLETHEFVFTSNPQLSYIHYTEQLEKAEFEKYQKLEYLYKEPGYYCSETAEIGKGAYIEPGCVIGHGVRIGKNAKIFAGAVIKNAIIGDFFICGENNSIGTNGFTMADDENGNKIRLPSLGGVLIGNNVEVGSSANISRGSAGDTVIEDNVKIDALVHIGHDAHIHRNVEITASAVIGGFDELMEGAYVGINAAVRNRRRVGENVIVGMGATVIRDVDAGQVIGGSPAKPLRHTVM